MGAKEFVLAIVVLVLFYKLFDNYVKARGARAADEADTPVHEVLAQVTALEERVCVLERIVTDDGFDLRREVRRHFRDPGG